MKKIHFVTAMLLYSIAVTAQPDIQHSIYFKEKYCIASDYAPYRYYVSHSNGNVYATHTLHKKLYVSKVKSDWDTISLNVFPVIGNSPDIFVTGIVELPNTHLLIAGYSDAFDGGNMWGYDGRGRQVFMMETDTLGNHIKTKTFGVICRLNDIQTTSDGYIILAGVTYGRGYEFNFPVNGDPTSVFLAKFDGNLNNIWYRMIDNNGFDEGPSLREVTPERYVVGYRTSGTDSLSVNIEAQGSADLVVYYMDSSAQNIYWMHRYGSSESDNVCFSINVDTLTKDIYFANICSNTQAPAPQISHTSGNVWILRVDSSGISKGSKRYGGYTGHYIPIAKWHNQKLWVTSYAKGVGGGDIDVNPNQDLEDTWIAVIDSNVNLVGKYTLQSEWNEAPTQLFIHNDDLYLAGRCLGLNNVPYKCDTANRFNFVFNLGLAPLGIEENSKYTKPFFELYPNPTSKNVYIRIDEQYISKACDITVQSVSGAQAYTQSIKHIQAIESIDCSSWASGSYIVTLRLPAQKKSASLKFSKQ